MANEPPPNIAGRGNWVLLDRLGEGGQGTVFRALPSRLAIARDDLVGRLKAALTAFGAVATEVGQRDEAARAILRTAEEWSRGPERSAYAALKAYSIPSGAAGDQARKRLQTEIAALSSMTDFPGVLQLRDSDAAGGWIATELHRRGSLDRHLHLYAGRAVEALAALRPVIAAVAHLHDTGRVHRDIKTANIFVGDDDGLILGDFGIVFFEDAAKS